MNQLTKVLLGFTVAVASTSGFAVDGLTGFVIQSNQGGSSSGILYADAKGQYLFAGSIINAQGQDLTQQYTNQYINSKIAGPAYAQALNLNFRHG